MDRFGMRLTVTLTAIILAAASAPAQDAGFWNALGTGVNGEVFDIEVHGDDIYVAGQFLDAGGNPACDNIARWTGSGWEPLGNGLWGSCRAIAFWNGELYAGGNFADAGGDQWADGIARWDGAAWHSLAVSGIGNGTVHALAASADALYIAGGFTDGLNAVGQPANIMKWDGATATGLFPSPNSVVWAVAVSGTDVYIGGSFLNLGGNGAIDCFAKWDGTAWSQMGSTLSNEVRAIAVDGAEIYIGGSFVNAGGDPNADRIARWNGTNWAWFPGSGGPSTTVRSIVPRGGDLYVGGSFYSPSSPMKCIAKWDGSAWFGLGAGLSAQVNVVAVHGGDVYAGGQFTDADGIPGGDHVARWHLAVSAAPLPERGPLVLFQNQPNPFNPATTIRFELAEPGSVRLRIHDARGRLVRDLLSADLAAGVHSREWDGRDDAGRPLPSGVYFCRSEAAGRQQVRKLVLAR